MSEKLTRKTSLEIANLLIQSPANKENIFNLYGIKTSTFQKHLHDIKAAGFEVVKEDGKYYIKEYKKVMDIATVENSLLAYLMVVSCVLLPEYKNKNIENLIDKIIQLSYKENAFDVLAKFDLYKYVIYSDIYKEKVMLLEKYINKKVIIKITILNKEEYIILPLKLELNRKKVYLHAIEYESRKAKTISLDRIIKIVPQKNYSYFPEAKETIFELYNKLAKSYLLKDNERIVDNYKDRIVVANSSSDKDTLFRRLLRYDVLCKVILPKSDARDFKEMIEKSLDNLEKFEDNNIG